MPQTMTLDEKLSISNKACALLDAGDRDGYERLTKTMPLPPYMAKVLKDKLGDIGVTYLKTSGWNLSEVEAKFGSDWLNK